MSFLDNLFRTDSSKASAPAPVAPASTIAFGDTGGAPAQAPQAQVPAPAAQPDPLDTLWKAPTPEELAGRPTPMDFNIDPAQMAQIAGKIDYRNAISPEIRARIAGGGEDGIAATLEAINVANQMNFQQAAMATTKMVEAAIKDTESRMDDRIDARLKLGGLNESLAADLPALTNPRYAPLVNIAKQEILSKFPNATQAEIKQYTVRYLQEFAGEANPELVRKANTNASNMAGYGNRSHQPETDWFEWAKS